MTSSPCGWPRSRARPTHLIGVGVGVRVRVRVGVGVGVRARVRPGPPTVEAVLHHAHHRQRVILALLPREARPAQNARCVAAAATAAAPLRGETQGLIFIKHVQPLVVERLTCIMIEEVQP